MSPSSRRPNKHESGRAAPIGVKLRSVFCCQHQKTENIQHFVVKDFTAKTAKRVHGYLIRLTRGYTDGGMDSRADEYWFHFHQQKTSFLLMKIELAPRKCSLRRPCIHG